MNENFIKALINQMTPDQMKGMLIELMQQPQITATSETIHNDNNEEIVALQTQIKELQQQPDYKKELTKFKRKFYKLSEIYNNKINYTQLNKKVKNFFEIQ